MIASRRTRRIGPPGRTGVALAWFAACGVTIRRVPTDNAWAYTTTTRRTTCTRLGPAGPGLGDPGPNGKVERFHRVLLE